MNVLNRALQLADRFIEAATQLRLANAFKVFSYLWGCNSETSILCSGTSFYFHPKADKGVMSHFYKEGYSILGPVRVILDVGANIGDETLRFRYFHPNALILAIEASSRNFELLNKTFSHDLRVHCIKAALWKSSGILNLHKGISHEAFSLFSDGNRALESVEEVKALSVPELLRTEGLENARINIFKIDVEGAEKAIFCDGENYWIANVDVFIMEIPDNDMPGSFQLIYGAIASFAVWHTFICGENIVMIREGSDFTLKRVIGFDY